MVLVLFPFKKFTRQACTALVYPHKNTGRQSNWYYSCSHLRILQDSHVGIAEGRKLKSTKMGCSPMVYFSHKNFTEIGQLI
jgi:hypothetical protein